MHRRRHFHGLTLLPDGTTAATSGNSCGNGIPGTGGNSCFASETTLLECTEGEADCVPVIEMPCTVAADCPAWAVCGTQADPDCPEDQDCTCNPLNNACYGVLEAELWDPVTQQWCLMAEQNFERMYHSSSILVPDGRVVSSGNGRRGGLTDHKTAEFFAPPYLLRGDPRPVVTAINGVAPSSAVFPQLDLGAEVTVELDPAGPTFDEVGRVTLVGLGSVTHQFDMNQRFVDLGCFWPSRDGRAITVNGPEDANVAPPGHYMLFVLSEAGTPSEGRYVHVGG